MSKRSRIILFLVVPIILIVILAFLYYLFFRTRPTADTNLTNKTYTKEELIQKYDSTIDVNNVKARSLYSMEPYLSAMLSAYEATGDTKYLDQTVDVWNYLQAKLTDINEDGYQELPAEGLTALTPGWDNDKNPNTPNRVYCEESDRGVRQFARYVKLVKAKQELAANYGSSADQIATFIKHDIIEDPFCKSRYTSDWVTVTHLVSHPTLTMLELYLAGQGEEYLPTIQENAQRLKNALMPQQEDTEAIIWSSVNCQNIDTTYPKCYYINERNCSDTAGHTGCVPADTSHADNFVFTVNELHRANIVFEQSDIDKFIYTFVNRIWDGNMLEPKFYDMVDGKLYPSDGTRYEPWVPGSNVAPGWVSLGEYEPALNQIFMNLIDSQASNKNWLNYPALYAELAKNLALGGTVSSDNPRVILSSDSGDNEEPVINNTTNDDQTDIIAPNEGSISSSQSSTSINLQDPAATRANSDLNISSKKQGEESSDANKTDTTLTTSGPEKNKMMGILFISLASTYFTYFLKRRLIYPY